MNRLLSTTIVLLMTMGQVVLSQKLAVKGNLLYGGWTQTPNLGVEMGLSQRTTLDLGAGYNPWNVNGSVDNNKKLAHWIGQAEYRYWTCQKFNGHFFGVHALYTQYNISEHNLPLLFGSGSQNYRFQGDAIGGGISYGYQWLIGRRWNLEANLGVGVAFMRFDRYGCTRCGNKIATENRTYYGPTKAGISLIYIIK